MNTPRQRIVLDYARWTALSALRSGSPIKSRGDIYPLLDGVKFDEVLQTRTPITHSEFGKWHKSQTSQLCRRAGIAIGWGAKLINVYLKTAAYIGDLGRPGLRECIHPPIDAGLWKGVREKFPDRHDIVDEVCCVQRIKDITRYSTYLRIVKGCRVAAEALACSLIEVEQLWVGSKTPDLPGDGKMVSKKLQWKLT